MKLNPHDGIEIDAGNVLWGRAAKLALEKLVKLEQEWDRYPVNEDQWDLLTDPAEYP